ncbi:hypothetical protein GmRootV118_20440 [Variovorax sp. V118]|uniref:hypothetical protein n=1 Tax=Variovorax sp. V118 TaxID=3065954 RepID=UPI0034E86F2C
MSLCRAVVASEDEALALPVYQVQPAQPAVAGWLRNLLTPVVAACRLRNTYPVEFRPTGLWGGWADSPDSAPDRRVAISNLALHRTKRGLVTTFLHEVAHHLTGIEHGHDAYFFAVNLMLLLRVSAASGAAPQSIGALADTMQLYDLAEPPAALQHEPDAGVGRAMAWAIAVAHEMAPTHLTAEDAAAAICDRYATFVAELEAAPAKREAAASARARAAAEAEGTRRELRSTTRLLRSISIWLAVTGAVALVEAFLVVKLSLS